MDPGGGEFAKNIATIGAFRVLNIGLVAGARRLFPQQGFLQLATIATGNAAIAAAPALLSALESRQWTDDTTALLVGTLLAHVIGSGLLNLPPGVAESEILLKLRTLGIAEDALADMAALQAENATLGAEWKAAVAAGRLDQEKAASLQKRAVRVAERSASAARRLAASGLTDDQLATLKLPSRAGLIAWADLASDYGAAVNAMPNPGMPPGGRSLCVPKTLSELKPRWNRLSWRNDRAALFRSGHPGLAVQVEVAA